MNVMGGADLTDEVAQLKREAAAQPTNATTIAWRARVLADWIDAQSLAGLEVGLEGPNIRRFATTPPRGQGAVAASRNVDQLIREFRMREEEPQAVSGTLQMLEQAEARFLRSGVLAP